MDQISRATNHTSTRAGAVPQADAAPGPTPAEDRPIGPASGRGWFRQALTHQGDRLYLGAQKWLPFLLSSASPPPAHTDQIAQSNPVRAGIKDNLVHMASSTGQEVPRPTPPQPWPSSPTDATSLPGCGCTGQPWFKWPSWTPCARVCASAPAFWTRRASTTTSDAHTLVTICVISTSRAAATPKRRPMCRRRRRRTRPLLWRSSTSSSCRPAAVWGSTGSIGTAGCSTARALSATERASMRCASVPCMPRSRTTAAESRPRSSLKRQMPCAPSCSKSGPATCAPSRRHFGPSWATCDEPAPSARRHSGPAAAGSRRRPPRPRSGIHTGGVPPRTPAAPKDPIAALPGPLPAQSRAPTPGQLDTYADTKALLQAALDTAVPPPRVPKDRAARLAADVATAARTENPEALLCAFLRLCADTGGSALDAWRNHLQQLQALQARQLSDSEQQHRVHQRLVAQVQATLGNTGEQVPAWGLGISLLGAAVATWGLGIGGVGGLLTTFSFVGLTQQGSGQATLAWQRFSASRLQHSAKAALTEGEAAALSAANAGRGIGAIGDHLSELASWHRRSLERAGALLEVRAQAQQALMALGQQTRH